MCLSGSSPEVFVSHSEEAAGSLFKIRAWLLLDKDSSSTRARIWRPHLTPVPWALPRGEEKEGENNMGKEKVYK